MRRYFFFIIDVLLTREGEFRSECTQVFGRLHRAGVSVVVCGAERGACDVLTLLRTAGLLERVDYVRCTTTLDSLVLDISNCFIVSSDSVVVGNRKAHLALADQLGCQFCLSAYNADIAEFRGARIRIASSLMKMLPLFKIYKDEKPEPLDYAKPFKGFSSPIKIPETVCCEKIYYPLAEKIVDEASNIRVLHVRDFITLVQAVDKIKFLGSQKSLKVFLRGQSSLYSGKLIPSAYRHGKKKEVDKQIEGRISMFKEVAGKNLGKMDDDVIEGLFQQYEQSSRWVDAVDNIWVALWFACQRRWEEGGLVQYVRRNSSIERSKFRYAYILVLGVVPELNEFILDLRERTPSMFVRPHVQHGVLLQKRRRNGRPMKDMTSIIQGVIRIDLDDALSWIGNVPSLSASSMFPNPSFDSGFKVLIEDGQKVRTGIVFK